MWTDSSIEAYNEYLTYADEWTQADLIYHNKLGECIDPIQFESSDSILEHLNEPEHCSKLQVSNFANLDNLDIYFIFNSNMRYREILISLDNDEFPISYKSRTIVPKSFEDEPQLAGTMKYHEIIIDGSNCNEIKHTKLKFYIHPDSPIKIDISNCYGSCIVTREKSYPNPSDKITWNKDQMKLIFFIVK